MYSELFCKIYDALGWNTYPETFAASLLQWISKKGISVKSALDIGCGPGVLSGILREHGIDACGMDLSEGMVALAREKYPDVCFEQGNMITYRPGQNVDLVTSTCDAVNHLLKPEDVARTFDNIASYINPGGYFIFDLLKEDEVHPCDPVDLGEMDGGQVQYCIRREGREFITLQIDFLVKGERRMREEIRERIYAPEYITELLEAAGFTKVCYRNKLLEEQAGQGTTWLVIAMRGG